VLRVTDPLTDVQRFELHGRNGVAP